MKVLFSDHAVGQIRKRKISKQLILEVINEPEKEIGSFRTRRLLQKRFGGKILEVVIVRVESILTVITAYYLEEKS
jgi:hypothetical protein